MRSVARALLGQPRLLLLDEPLEDLAPPIRLDLLRALAQLQDLTVAVVEQQVHEVLGYAQRALILDRGRVVHEDRAANLREDSAALERRIGLAVQ